MSTVQFPAQNANVVDSRRARSALPVIGQILLHGGSFEEGDVDAVLAEQSRNGGLFGDIALRLGRITPQQLELALAQQFRFPSNGFDGTSLAKELVAANSPFRSDVEAMRSVRTNLMLNWFGTGQRSLAVVSPQSGDGRSYVAANLAICFAQLGRRTLLIDADLRQPKMHTWFNVPANAAGLTGVLAGRVGLDQVRLIPGFDYLSVLVAGSTAPNPQELLAGGALSDLIYKLRTQYDVILIDTPAANRYADVDTIASIAGGAVVVTRKGETKMEQAGGLVERLSSLGVKILGGVMNAV